mgnify:CR=1 FL=1
MLIAQLSKSFRGFLLEKRIWHSICTSYLELLKKLIEGQQKYKHY